MSALQFATTIDQVKGGRGEIRAGSTDVSDRRRMGVSDGDILDISRMAGLDGIKTEANGRTTIGALVKMAAAAQHPHLVQNYAGLAMATGALATPQIRAMGTMGGVVLQSSRCWYYRNPAFKASNGTCPGHEGDHRFGVIFGDGGCVFPHPSTVGMVLLNYGAEVEIDGQKRLTMRQLYGEGKVAHQTHTLKSDELLTQIILPEPVANERAAYFRAISRARAEWALVEASVRLVVDTANTITFARVAVGGVASLPLLLSQVNAALEGQPATPETFQRAARLATEGAKPLPQTGYKVPLLYGTVLETLQRAYDRVWGGEG